MAIQGAGVGELHAIPGEDLHAFAVEVGTGEASSVGAEVHSRKFPLPFKGLDQLAGRASQT
jgi:hypothetical protein